MAFVVDQPKQFYQSGPLMEDGMQDAILAEITDLGMEAENPVFLMQKQAEAKTKGKDPASVPTSVHKCMFIYRKEDGTEANEKLTVSLHEKATMRKRVKAITGEEPTAAFDLESLVGSPVFVQIEHNISKKGNKYAKVMSVARKKGAPKSAYIPPKVSQPVPTNAHGVAATNSDLGF